MLAGFRGAFVGAAAGIEDILGAVEQTIMVGETIKKIPDYNIEGVCQIAYQVSHLKQTFHDIRMDDQYLECEAEPVSVRNLFFSP